MKTKFFVDLGTWERGSQEEILAESLEQALGLAHKALEKNRDKLEADGSKDPFVVQVKVQDKDGLQAVWDYMNGALRDR